MSSRTLDEHVEVTPDTAGGRPRIRGRRIAVQDTAIWHERLGKSADEIAADYDLTLAVYAALAYYFDHREEIDGRLTEDRAFAGLASLRCVPGPWAAAGGRRWTTESDARSRLTGRGTGVGRMTVTAKVHG
jgi:uncharacterized protein (DUF433 family)